jgi:hypothetical protein
MIEVLEPDAFPVIWEGSLIKGLPCVQFLSFPWPMASQTGSPTNITQDDI